MDVTAQQTKLEGMGEPWKRPRQGEQGISEEQCKEQRGRLRKLFNPEPQRLKVQEEGRRQGGGGKLEVARGPDTVYKANT